jgi:hypothetical protein
MTSVHSFNGHKLYEEFSKLTVGDPKIVTLTNEMRELYQGVLTQLPQKWKPVYQKAA